MKKKSVIFAAIAIVLILAANLPLAWGYFSTYTEARGIVRLRPRKIETEIKEEVSNWTKHVVITNSADGSPVYVRARAFAGTGIKLTYEGSGWTLRDDGFYYYNGILEAGGETPELLVKIDKETIPEGTEGQEFNVVVVYESTPVRYDESGNPYADWEQPLKVRERSAE